MNDWEINLQELQECIKDKTNENTQEMQKCILNMICEDNAPIPLSQADLYNALKIEGEFLVLKLHYSDYEEELKNLNIKYKISQALSVIVSYEDDGSSFDALHQFVEYIHGASDTKQNSSFGVKTVDTLSEFPITILFSGILPINQLRMTVGKQVDALIHSDDTYFVPRFQSFRDLLSTEIGIPILPVLPVYDENLGEYQVRLVDLLDGRVISEFEVIDNFSKETIEMYLVKLFYVYKLLAKQGN